MSLEKILEKIKKQAEEEILAIQKNAEIEVGKIEDHLSSELAKKEERFFKETEGVEREIRNKTLLPAKMDVKKRSLEIKRAMIDRLLRRTLDFSPEEYKKVLGLLISSVEEVEGGTLYPAKGKEELIKEFVREKKLKIKIGESREDIFGGFIMTAGKIEYDCSFDMLLRSLKGKLEPKIGSLLVKRET